MGGGGVVLVLVLVIYMYINSATLKLGGIICLDKLLQQGKRTKE